jgi:uncharacterized membrane protein
VPQLTPSEEKAVVAAIAAAEQRTSGEIRVHLEKKCAPEQAHAEAVRWFEKLRMHQTQERNGILFLLAPESHAFAVVGDAGIHACVGDSFWEDVREAALAHFREGRLGDGLVAGIHLCGEQLHEHFPFDGKTDQNELSDEISRNA